MSVCRGSQLKNAIYKMVKLCRLSLYLRKYRDTDHHTRYTRIKLYDSSPREEMREYEFMSDMKHGGSSTRSSLQHLDRQASNIIPESLNMQGQIFVLTS